MPSKALIVTDKAVEASALHSTLADQGLAVWSSWCAPQALRIFAGERPEALLLSFWHVHLAAQFILMLSRNVVIFYRLHARYYYLAVTISCCRQRPFTPVAHLMPAFPLRHYPMGWH
ncbi:hypothetical protein [Glaciimonas immobilis]|uniref:Uncharacterized protein n=1 Tax=Glaciimonas immobilis TaxID=728004 RepID=A0A840RQ34_9BURK|nr:hypothetical protein [Glaciimonas immobilis]KAF3998174.1 hypothetical protein HAV38_11585 [Glaciimonas immobilis]MBB5199116.1 hypothetical protein [Glaciimonas immobilis]